MIQTWVGVVMAYILIGVLVVLIWCRTADDDTADSEALWLAVCLWPIIITIFVFESISFKSIVKRNTDQHNRRIGR